MKRLGWLVAVVCASFLAPACGGESEPGESVQSGGAAGAADAGSSGDPSVGPETPLEDYPRAYAEVLCQVIERCDPRVIAFLAGQSCVATFEPVVRDQILGGVQASIAAGTVVYHPDALPKCLSDWAKASCDDANRDVPACEAVFSGTLASGAACQNDVECEAGQCLVADQCPGTCGAPGGLGGPCSLTNACELGLHCAAGRCEKAVRLGEACDASTQCLGYGLCYADPASPSEPSRCVERGKIPLAPEGAPCEITQEPICADGLVCTRSDDGDAFGTCQPKAALGGECTYSFPDACPSGQYCRFTSGFGDAPHRGLCTVAPRLGESCVHGEIFSAPCATDQLCDHESGLCVTGKRLNEDCATDDECFSAHCSAEGTCTSQLECEKVVELGM